MSAVIRGVKNVVSRKHCSELVCVHIPSLTMRRAAGDARNVCALRHIARNVSICKVVERLFAITKSLRHRSMQTPLWCTPRTIPLVKQRDAYTSDGGGATIQSLVKKPQAGSMCPTCRRLHHTACTGAIVVVALRRSTGRGERHDLTRTPCVLRDGIFDEWW